jgi:hypothetical protein
MTTLCARRSAPLLAAVILIISSALGAQAACFLIDTQFVLIDPTTQDVQFSITFNQAPDFFVVDAYGRPEDQFQYKTPDSVIRGGEIYITGNTLRIRSYGPSQSGPAGGWGPVVVAVPYSLIGNTLTFSAPLHLFSATDFFSYEVATYSYGLTGSDLTAASQTPEPATWAMMLLGFAGLGYVGCRKSFLTAG